MAKIDNFNNGDSGLSIRNKILQALKTVEVDNSTITGDGINTPLAVDSSQLNPVTFPLNPVPNVQATTLQAAFLEITSELAQNVKIVNKESDFPVQDATTITCEEGVTYFIGSPFSTAKTIILNDSGIYSYNNTGSTPLINYTGTGVAIKNAPTKRGNISGISISAPNGTLFQVDGDNTGNATQRLNIDRIVSESYNKIVSFTGGGALVLSTASFTGSTASAGSSHMTFSGTNVLVINLSEVLVGGLKANDIFVNLGTTTTREIEFTNVILVGDSSTKFISGLTNSGNIIANNKATVRDCNLSVLTNPLTNIQTNDIRWFFRDNAGISDSRVAADTYLVTTRTVPIASTGVFTLIDGSVWDSEVSDRFLVDNTGTLTYIGEDDLNVKCSMFATLEKVGGGSDRVELRLAKNGTTLLKSRGSTRNNQPTNVSTEALISISTGDTLALYVANLDSNTDVLVYNAALTVILA